ncbi:uncharacterized protein NESG_01456 [Nematocida ausubeli]|uniref:Uncharacterized protein n=1 Tax=Nematocida ausubeli (strain ATCC PRA-371 / ERTm2) TaxID=1913371 RepID=A0A086J2G7_NEMA1|nr:uncharacterized protein NESG_01456 [Nematocida ausubeli]KFG26335.1 hypothetical protein NESG_01456 [Nematocida ausubeli]
MDRHMVDYLCFASYLSINPYEYIVKYHVACIAARVRTQSLSQTGPNSSHSLRIYKNP